VNSGTGSPGGITSGSEVVNLTLMKNWDEAELGSLVHMASAPTTFWRHLGQGFPSHMRTGGGISLHLRQPPALNHEVADDAVKKSIRRNVCPDVQEKKLNQFRRFVGVHLQDEVAFCGGKFDLS
jgi:hypothetical protein